MTKSSSPSLTKRNPAVSTIFSSPDGETIGPIAFQPPPVAVKPLNGHSKAAVANSVESLLAAAEGSSFPAAEKLARQIREQVAELVALIKQGTREQELRSQIAERRQLLDEAIQQLADFKAKPASSVVHPGSTAQGAGQAAIRQWARSAGIEVPTRGTLPASVREAYEQAHGGEPR